jgi:hypothetical protein
LPVKLSATDVRRFSEFDTTRRAALAEPFAGGDASDMADLKKVLAHDPQLIRDGDLTGEWRCRTFKLGGILALTPYGFVRCRIFMEQGELVFQKTSGSQRTRGGLYRLTADRFAYVGASTVNDDPIRLYGASSREDQIRWAFSSRYRIAVCGLSSPRHTMSRTSISWISFAKMQRPIRAAVILAMCPPE